MKVRRAARTRRLRRDRAAGRARGPARRADHREPQLDADAAGLRADRAVPAARVRRRRGARPDGAAELRRSEPAAVAGPAGPARGPGRAGHGVRAGDDRRRDRQWDPLGAVQERLAALERDLAHEQDPVARPHWRAGSPSSSSRWPTRGDRRVLVAQVRRALRLRHGRRRDGRRRGRARHDGAVADRLLARRVGSRRPVPVHERGTERAVLERCRSWPAITRSARERPDRAAAEARSRRARRARDDAGRGRGVRARLHGWVVLPGMRDYPKAAAPHAAPRWPAYPQIIVFCETTTTSGCAWSWRRRRRCGRCRARAATAWRTTRPAAG